MIQLPLTFFVCMNDVSGYSQVMTLFLLPTDMGLTSSLKYKIHLYPPVRF